MDILNIHIIEELNTVIAIRVFNLELDNGFWKSSEIYTTYKQVPENEIINLLLYNSILKK
jgi:hypothetical protein